MVAADDTALQLAHRRRTPELIVSGEIPGWRFHFHHRQLPSAAIALATSTGTASRPMLAYAVRQSGLIAFSIAIASFDFFSGSGGDGTVKTPREPEPSRTISRAAFLRAASRSMRGASEGRAPTSRRGWKISSSASGVPKRDGGTGAAR